MAPMGSDPTNDNADPGLAAFLAPIRAARREPDNSDATLIRRGIAMARGWDRDVNVPLDPPPLNPSDPFGDPTKPYGYFVAVRVRRNRAGVVTGEIVTRPKNAPPEWGFVTPGETP